MFLIGGIYKAWDQQEINKEDMNSLEYGDYVNLCKILLDPGSIHKIGKHVINA